MAPGGESPTVRLRRLASELRRLRKASGLTNEAVAETLGVAQSWVSRAESGRRRIRPIDLRALLDVYGVQGPQREELLLLGRQASQKGWWHTYGDAIPERLQIYVGLEAEATQIRAYYSQLIPGLLQTADYYRSYLAVTLPDAAPDEVERMIEFRLARQERVVMEEDSAMKLTFILNEACLRRWPLDDTIAQAQLRHLLKLSKRPNITLQVVPFDVGLFPAMGGTFVMLGFPVEADPDVVYIEHQVDSLYLEDPATVERYSMIFDQIRAKALSPSQTRTFISSLIKEA
ncbi:helix-turn-helix domain-containing protein [Spongiactinospora rosea]|nr:helix-turn-helix transcriptional regulator [Spongiactinospora rosea]